LAQIEPFPRGQGALSFINIIEGVRMRDYDLAENLGAKTLLNEAYLETAPPSAVYQWLQNWVDERGYARAEVPRSTWQKLAQRGDSFVDHALARFCEDQEVLADLWRREDDKIRCAILTHADTGLSHVGDDGGLEFFRDTPLAVAEAALSAPHGFELLEQCLNRSKPFDRLPDERWWLLLARCAASPILRSPHESGYDDGYDDYRARRAVAAAWSLLDRLPVTLRSVGILTNMLENSYFKCPQEDQLGFVRRSMERWSDPGDRPDSRDGWQYSFLRETIACKSARQITTPREEALTAYLQEHEDLAVRKGYYSGFRPGDAEEVQAAFERDEYHFLDAGTRNDHFYRKDGSCAAAFATLIIQHPSATVESDVRIYDVYWDRMDELTLESPNAYGYSQPDEAPKRAKPIRDVERAAIAIGRFIAEMTDQEASRSDRVNAEKHFREVFERLAESLIDRSGALAESASLGHGALEKRQAAGTLANRGSGTGRLTFISIGVALLMWAQFIGL
jgi:hypothetical protein